MLAMTLEFSLFLANEIQKSGSTPAFLYQGPSFKLVMKSRNSTLLPQYLGKKKPQQTLKLATNPRLVVLNGVLLSSLFCSKLWPIYRMVRFIYRHKITESQNIRNWKGPQKVI